jgi:glycosidase
MQGLGATAVWLTPPVLNQWDAPHGFWRLPRLLGQHFKKVDPHVGTLADYRAVATRCTAAACTWCRTSW